jgi:transcription initiation factor IIE alpha subunit
MTQDELAGMANLSRQTIGPILRALAEEGHITANYRSITLKDPFALRVIVDS